MATLRKFTLWLSQQNDFRSRIKQADAEYFKLPRRDDAEARTATARPAQTVKQADRALAPLPKSHPQELRDKEVFVLLCLIGIRVGAPISLCIKHIDFAEKSVTQNPCEVATTCGKPFDTFFFAKSLEEAEAILMSWLNFWMKPLSMARTIRSFLQPHSLAMQTPDFR